MQHVASTSCPLRSTEAAASNDCYYIYRLGHYNKISKYLVIIQFESCHKSGCKRATAVCCCCCHTSCCFGSSSSCSASSTYCSYYILPFIGYLPALPLTGPPKSQKAWQMCAAWRKKGQNIVAWAQHMHKHSSRDTMWGLGTDTHTGWTRCLLHPLQRFNFHNCYCPCIKLMKRIPASLFALILRGIHILPMSIVFLTLSPPSASALSPQSAAES